MAVPVWKHSQHRALIRLSIPAEESRDQTDQSSGLFYSLVLANLGIRAANATVTMPSSAPSYSKVSSELEMHRSSKPPARRISAKNRRKTKAVEGFAPGGEIVVYKAPDGEIQLDVHLKGETVWLTQVQMAELFGRGQSVISRHLRNVFLEGELKQKSNMQNLHIAGSDKPVGFYSLDAIISVGYRVNSRRGTQFRIWATKTLRSHLLKGFSLHERRLRERSVDFEQALALLSRTLTSNSLVTDEGRDVLDVVRRYTRTWRLLLEYDENRLAGTPELPTAVSVSISVDAARAAITNLREVIGIRDHAAALFGREHGERLAGIIGAIEQTSNGKPLYASAEARAAHLLYFVVKDHPFVDGNKRIGTLLFLEYLWRNGLLMRMDGSLRLTDNAMVALALLIAESEPSQKDLMIRLTLNLLADRTR
jgi:prophage maintenance system killer protein